MLECTLCHATQRLPKHCGQGMSVQQHEGRAVLACWMGPGCGWQEIPEHCGAAMRVKVD